MNKKAIKVLMVVYSYLPYDSRVRREANALIQNGYDVDIICIKYKDQPIFEVIDGINIYRLNIERSRSTKGRYILLYLSFFIRAFIKTNYLWFKNKYKVVHVHNMPDFLVFVASLQKLFGVKVILDLHDPTPEVFMTKFGFSNWFIKALKFQEKSSIAFAAKIITTNIAFVNTFIERNCPAEKITIVMNSPDENVFGSNMKNKNPFVLESRPDKFILMYHGIIVERHGLDIAVKAVDLLKDKIPGLEFWVFGAGEFTDSFLSLVNQLSLENKVKYFGLVSIEKIVETIPSASLGIIPNRLGPFTNINFPTRIFEYLYFRKPVIVPKTRGISDYFSDDSIFYFQPEDINNLADVILSIYNNSVDVNKVIQNGYNVYYNHRWESQSKSLINMYKNLCPKN